MKHLILFSIATLWMLASSCSDDSNLGLSQQGNKTIIHLSADDTQTRSGSLPEAEGYHLRYILEAYLQTTSGELAERVSRSVQTDPTFSLQLSDNEKYTLVAWADFASSGADNATLDSTDDEFYTTEPLTAVSMNTSKWELNTSAKDAFSVVKKDFTTENNEQTLTLRRSLALLNLKSENDNPNIKEVKITYKNLYTQFNVVTQDVIGNQIEKSYVVNKLTNDDNIWAFDYLFTHPLQEGADYKDGTTLYNLDVELYKEDGETVKQFAIDYVPFSPNYKTNLILTPGSESSVDVKIEIDADFETPEVDGNRPFIVSSYIRGSFFKTNRVPASSMNACNDLIFLVSNPYADGSIYFEIPDNQANFTNVTYLDEFEGKSGVIQFSGTGEMNGGYDLLNTANGDYPQFTFATWLYVDQWNNNSYLFKKELNGKQVALRLGDTPGKFVFYINNDQVELEKTNWTSNQWHHIALTHSTTANNKGTALYIDGEKYSPSQSLTTKVPFMQTEMKLGVGFEGKLDNTYFNMLALSESEIKTIKDTDNLNYNSWNISKTLAYWKYDNAGDYGKDDYTWMGMLQEIRSQLASKEIKVRLGVASGSWQAMCDNATARNKFAANLKTLLDSYQFDGVDLDFEWPANTESAFNGYNETVKKIREVIGYDYIFSVTLHPIYYKMSMEAIDKLDFVSIQAYGPSPERFPYSQFVADTKTVLAHGIPKEKLVMGVPFYGVESNGNKGTEAYHTFVTKDLITDSSQNYVTYNSKTYVFDGQDAIKQKTHYIRDNHLYGIMFWDIATDVDFTHEKSLLKAVVEELQ